MGNENSKDLDLTQNGIYEKHENGEVKGLSLTITSNGHVVDGPTKTATEQNEEPPSEEVKTESTEVVVQESESQPAEAEVTPEIPDSSLQTEELKLKEKKSNFFKMFKKKAAPVEEKETEGEKEVSGEEQTDPSPPANDPQTNGIHKKHENGEVKGLSLTITSNGLVVDGPTKIATEEKQEPPLEEVKTELTEVVVQKSESQPAEAEVTPEIPDSSLQTEELKLKEKKSNFFKMFKKKAAPVEEKETEGEKEVSGEEQTDPGPPANDPQTVTPTKASKKEAPAPDAKKDQPQQESQPAAATTVAQVSDPPAAAKGMPAPPPPPPEPPKLDIKADPAAKAVKATPKEEPKPAAKDSPKTKSLSRLFRIKTKNEIPQPTVEVEVQETLVEVPQPIVDVKIETNVETQETADVPQTVVEDQADTSKAATLEATAKPEPAPPVQEEKKAEDKSSFFSFFKPKAAEPKVTPAPAAAAEPGPAKEEAPKAAKSAEASAESKPATSAPSGGQEAGSAPKKLEKRNSIHLFFKTLGQRRPSTDAGAQTETAAAAPSAEKAK